MPPSRPRLVTTLSRAATRVRASPARFGGVIVTDGVTVCQSGPERRDRHDAVAFREPHHDYAAGARRVAVDRIRVGPDDLAAGRNEQELLVFLGDLLDRRDDAGLLALEGDQPDALAAAVLLPELAEGHTLAVAGLGQHEEVRVGVDDRHRDDAVAGLLQEPDADDARGVAAHRPDLVLVERSEERRVGKECRSRRTAWQIETQYSM